MLKCKIIITILALIIGNVAPAHAASWTATNLIGNEINVINMLIA